MGPPERSLQSRLETAEDDDAAVAAEPTIGDPAALLHHLDVSGHFHRDGRLGRLYHRGMVSLRENTQTDSLHVSVDGNHLAAHVDRVSPLSPDSDGASAYSFRQALAHNLAGMYEDLLWLLRGRQGDHRCELDCEWIPAGAEETAAGELDLLDPRTGSWSVQMDARVAGSLDEARLRAALAAALGSDVAARDCLSVADCHDDEALRAARGALHRAAVAADARPPLRACLARHHAGDVLMLCINHAASDGFGALQVLQAIAAAYSGADPVPLDFLATRDLPVRPATTVPSVPARMYSALLERLRDTRDRPARLAADEPEDDAGCGYHLVALSERDTRRVVAAEDGPRADTDVLMAALHLAIADWNATHDAGGGRIGVLVQADLRPAEWHDHPVGNFSVTARMSTTAAERSDAAATLQTISAEIARNKRTRTGVALIAALERADLLALWAKQSIVVLRPLTGNHLVDTTVLCNLGELAEAPSFGPDAGEAIELWFSTPARGPLSLCLGAVTVGGRLHLTFRYPHRVLGPDAARRFADCYVRQLRLVGDIGDVGDVG
jgi:NRPS condensation-like uncharacterized protein